MEKIIYLVTKSEWGGAQEYIYNLATSLPKDKFDVLVLAGEGNGKLFKELAKQNIKYRKLKYTKRSINIFYDKLALLELIKIFKHEKPNIIHLNSSKIGFLGSLATKFLPTTNYPLQTIYTAHGWVFNEPLPFLSKKLYYFIEKLSAKWKDTIITVSKNDEQIANKFKFKSKIITIPNAVDPDNLDFLNKDEAIKKISKNAPWRLPSKLIGTIANLYPTKGLNYLIDTAKLLPQYKFIIIGEGPARKNLENQIKHLTLKNIILKGSIPQAHKYLKAFSCFILPSVKEGMPYVILKAIASDVPIVTTCVGGLPEVVDNNFLVKPADPKALADKINEVIKNPDLKQQHTPPSFHEFLKKTIELY